MSSMFVFGSNSKGFKEFKSAISFSLKSLYSVLLSSSMFFSVFFFFSVLFPFFNSLLIKRILLSSELIKMFLLTLMFFSNQFFVCLIFRTLACLEEFSIALSTGSLLKSNSVGRLHSWTIAI